MKKEVFFMLDLTPIKHRPGLPTLFREMETVFKNLLHDFPFGELPTEFEAGWTPRMDVSETDEHIEIKAELPGLEKKDIDISLDRDTLVIKGEKKHEKEEKWKTFHRIERSYGSFYRTLRLPTEVETGKIDATFKDGVLTIKLPKSEESQKKIAHIEVH